ncbi:MAG: tripartite tricarboxylate transporter substrate binding protein [Bacillota bacterium]
MKALRPYLVPAIVALIVAAAGGVASAEWPNDRPITMIVAYSPGGATDIAARLLAPYIEKYLGQSIIILNRPGAGGEVGFTALATAAPDGYTVGFINTPNVVTIPIERRTRYTLESFIPVANVMDDPDAFLVRADSPFRTLQELVEYAKKNPGTVSYGTSGIGSDDHIATEMFARAAGLKLRHIPFDGAAPNRTALLGGHITLGVFNISEAKEYVENGQLRILGQMAEGRTELFPNTPTFREQGYNIVTGSQRGIAMPAGTPGWVVERFAQAAAKAVNDPEFREKAAKAYLPLRYLGPNDYRAFLRELRDSYQELWNASPWVEKR